MRTLAFVFVLFSSITATAQQAIDPAAIRAFETFAEQEMKRDRMTALSVAVLQGDAIWARGFGFADIENQVPATEKSSYRMASVTKPMTAVAAMKLAEMGVLDLDAPVQKYVPYFPDKGKTITTRLLLAHLGGISHYRDYSVEGTIREPKTTREAVAIFEKFDLVNEPGREYNYSSYGYNLVGAVIEGATGKKYGDAMRELVWAPAGMTDTRMDSPTDLIPHRVTGYRLDDGELKRSQFVDISSRFAAGGTRSTVVDMVRFAKAVDDGKILRSESIDPMWWPSKTSSGEWIPYGLGWSVHSVNGHFHVAHSGSQQETRTLLAYFPERDLAIAFASNFEDADFGRYRNYLYWLLTGEVWNPPAYAPADADREALRLADRLIDEGGIYFEKYGKPATTDARELRKAFRDLESPESFQIAGSWIASKAGVRDDGALAVLKRYVESRQQPRFDRALERRIVDLANEWQRVFTADHERRFVLEEDVEQNVAALRGLRVAPSYVGVLEDDIAVAFRRGDMSRVTRLAKLAGETYPENDRATALYGVALALSGDEAEAEKWLRRSVALDPEGYATPRRLANLARQIEQRAGPEAAATLTRIVKRIHPQ